MTRRLLVGYVLLTLFLLAVLEIPLGLTYARSERHELTSKLERDAVILATLSEDMLETRSSLDRSALRTMVRQYARDTGGNVVIVDARGAALVDSDRSTSRRRMLAIRPEIVHALEGDRTIRVRHSPEVGSDLVHVAEPVASGGNVHGAVRISHSLAAVDRRITRFWLILAAIAIVVLLAASLLGHRFAVWIGKPLRDLQQAAAAAGSRDLAVRAPVDAGPPEVRSLAESFNDTVEKLDDLVRAQEEFVADAAHQLRSPLAALRLRLENVEPTITASGRADLEGAVVEVDRLSRLVDGLLMLARADSSSSAVESIDLRPVVEERLEAWSALASEQGIELTAALEGELSAWTTPGRLEQVLDNLLANALDASPEGGSVTVTAATDARWVELHVVDEGPGLSAEERARAFDRLWRAETAEGGFGLGLAIVHRLVVSDGGEVELKLAPSRGIDAVVRLRHSIGRIPGKRAKREPIASV